MIGHVLWVMFQWPQGIVVGNLIASFIIWLPHTIHQHIRFKRIEDQLKRQKEK